MHFSGVSASCGAILFSVCLPVGSADFSRWHEVQGGAWRVDASLLPTIQSQMQGAADAWFHASPARNPVDLSTYVMQLQGQRRWHWLASRHVVRINGICPGAARDIPVATVEHDFYVVDDGGPCYFEATFDAEAKKLESFAFHGPY